MNVIIWSLIFKKFDMDVFAKQPEIFLTNEMKSIYIYFYRYLINNSLKKGIQPYSHQPEIYKTKNEMKKNSDNDPEKITIKAI